MPRLPEFSPFETPKGWCVSIPASMSSDSKRGRKYFQTPTAALKYAGQLRAAYARGIRGATISANLAIQAVEAERILDGTGISVVEAARMAVARLGDNASTETLKDRLKRAVIDGEGRWSERYTRDVGKIFDWVPESFLRTKCSVIGREEIEAALTKGRKLSRSTIDTRTRYVMAVLNYREKHRRKPSIAILTADETSAMLSACRTPDETMAVALLLFAGIRPDVDEGEISRLDWSAVGSEIYVSAEVSKTSDRHVPIYPRLARLIAGHPESGPVRPNNWQRRWPEIRKAAGVAAQDITRHTFCSHLLAWKGMVETQAAMGHVPLSSVTRAHYARSVTVEAGREYFA